MRLTNEVVLPGTPDAVFALINDVERVAPCMPGATLEGGSGEDGYRGRVKIKVGPISAAYNGTVRFLDVDDGARRLVLDAKGTDAHGSGNAEAKVTVRVRPHEQGSALGLDTDLVVRGKVAQFGRGAIGEVSQKLMEQFAQNLSGLLSGAEQAVAPGAAPAGSVQAPPTVAAAPGELDAMSLVVLPLLKRFAPVAAGLAAGVLAGLLAGRRGGSGRRAVLVDELVTATVHIGSERYRVPARRVVRFVSRR
ncbi:MAG: SRPBCC family protein [Sciscionella sp.]